MKIVLAVALIALVAFAAGVEAGKGGSKKVYASSKTLVTVEEGLHRFCIPIGKYSTENPKDLSLHIPHRASGLSVKLDSAPLNTFSNAAVSEKKHHKTSSVSLIHESQAVQGFTYSTSEVMKAGTISGFIIGEKPDWISVRIAGKTFQNIDNCTFIFCGRYILASMRKAVCCCFPIVRSCALSLPRVCGEKPPPFSRSCVFFENLPFWPHTALLQPLFASILIVMVTNDV